LAGPVVAACVILKNISSHFKNRIDDSKVLTPLARIRAYSEIIKKTIFSIGITHHEEIDRLNIYRATILSMEKSVNALGVKPDFILVDGNLKLNLPQKRLNIIGGDAKSLSIACASIIAKVTRDRIMVMYDKIYPAYGFKAHKGYGTKRHFAAIAKYGPTPIHRFSFRPLRHDD